MSNRQSSIVNRKFLATLFLVALAGCRPAKAPNPAAPAVAPQDPIVSLTFDDGNADNIPMGELLQQNGLHATFYIPSGLAGTQGFMTWDQIKSLQDAGNEIGGHTLHHKNLRGLDIATLRHEICDDRSSLESHGFNPVSFAYPFGAYDPNVKRVVKECGYAGARTVKDGPEQFPIPDVYAVRAFPYVVNDTNLSKLQRYISGTRQEGGGWVVLVFHHVCDGCDYFAVSPGVMDRFIPWLAQQQAMGHLQVKTFGEALQER
ncbi:MAG TPA: polysaccharide deacetylase family protein [Anaerolineales bacterium]|nr:polysaccharide deacetylase family protein [Anaerolineales bacterium]